MLSGKELILATRPFARENRALSWFHTLTAYSLLCSFLFGTLYFDYLPIKIFCSIGSALMVVRMFVIYHDHQHHAILHRSKFAEFIMTIFGIYMLAPTSIWKRSHDYHHKHNSKLFSASIGSYPIATKKKYLSMTPSERRAYLATRHPLTILGGYITMFLIGMALNSFLSSPRRHLDSLVALIIHITGSVLTVVFFGWMDYFLFIIVPFGFAGGLGGYLFYAQHNFPGVKFANNEDWAYEKAALQSSSFMVMSPFFNWVTANIGYHHIHHMNSRIPFYRLPEVMDHFPEFQKAKRTSLGLSDIVACLKLKVWDADKKELIPVKNLKHERVLEPASVE